MAFVVTAVATAVEVGTVAAIATAVSEVGIALSVVGAVTGNKDLMKIGGVLGLVGGVGSLAASFAGGAGAAAGAEGVSLGTAEGVGVGSAEGVNAMDAMSDAVTTGASSGASTAATAADTLAPSSIAENLAAPPAVAPEMATPATDATGSLAPQMQTTAPTVDTSSLGPQGAQAPQGALAPQGPSGPSTPFEDNFQGTSALTNPNQPGSLFDRFSSWVKANPKMAELGMQVVGGAMKGMSDYSLMNRKLDQNQQLINQTSYGNQVGQWSPQLANANPGIIGGARG